MKKFVYLSLISVLCSCSGSKGNKNATTTFYNPDLSYEQIMAAEEISQDEFKAAVADNYIEPKSRYELMKCTLTSDMPIPFHSSNYGVESLNTYYSLVDVPTPYENDPPFLFSLRTDLEGSLLGALSDNNYWMSVRYMYDVHEWLPSLDVIKAYKNPYAIEYNIDEIEIVRIIYDDHFLPIQVERQTPNSSPIKIWHYNLAYFSPKDVKIGKGNISKEAFAEHFMKICNNRISYGSYTVDIKGQYAYVEYGQPVASWKIQDYDLSLSGALLVQSNLYTGKEYPKSLFYIQHDQPEELYSDDRYLPIAGLWDVARMDYVLPVFPKFTGIMYEFFDSPLRVEGYYYDQNENSDWEIDYSNQYFYYEYNDSGLVTKIIRNSIAFNENRTKCKLELTFSYK